MSANLQNVVTQIQQIVQAINALTAIANGALAKVWGAFVPVALTDAATVTPDFSAGINFTLNIAASRTLANPLNPKVGQRGFIVLTQGTPGGSTLSFGSQYQAAGGVASLSPVTTAYAVNVFFYTVIPGPVILLTLQAGVVH